MNPQDNIIYTVNAVKKYMYTGVSKIRTLQMRHFEGQKLDVHLINIAQRPVTSRRAH